MFNKFFSTPKNKSVLLHFLKDVIQPAVPIEDVEILNPTLLKEQIDDKASILDLALKLSDGTRVDVELQVANLPGFR